VVLALAAAGATWADLEALARQGRYDEVIAAATQQLQSAAQPDKRLLYLRGYCAFHSARFELAEEDLSPLGDYAPGDKWPQASLLASRLGKLRALRPETVQEIRRGERCIFRLYYEEANPWTQSIVGLLPEAYDKVCGFYGVELGETSVVVFSTGTRYYEFFTALAGCGCVRPMAWQWASGGPGELLFCQHDADGSQTTPPGSAYQRSVVAHEFAHLALQRQLGAVGVPPWLNEGLAMACGALLSPDEYARNDASITGIMLDQKELPLSALRDGRRFYQLPNAAVAYAQSFALVRFLESEFGHERLLQVLSLLCEGNSTDEALKEACGMDSEAFYRQWHETTLKRLEEGPLH